MQTGVARIGIVAIAALVACRNTGDDGTGAAPGLSASAAANTVTSRNCAQLPFAGDTPVPEASAAAWLTLDGAPELLVIGDSGNRGAYGIIDPDSGKTLERGRLPLGRSSDDLEGAATRGDLVYGLISAGWIYVWRRSATGFDLVDGPYPLGPVDLPAKGTMLGDKPPEGDGMVCPAHGSNCGRNYEGLCLAPARDANGCDGYVVAKADGHMYCVAFDGRNSLPAGSAAEGQRGSIVGRNSLPAGSAAEGQRGSIAAAGHLAVRRDGAIAVDRPGWVADCTYAEDGTLWAGDNLFGMAQVFRIDTAAGRAVPFAQIGVGFPEVLAVRGDTFYRMSDTGGAPSLMAKFRCSAATK